MLFRIFEQQKTAVTHGRFRKRFCKARVGFDDWIRRYGSLDFQNQVLIFIARLKLVIYNRYKILQDIQKLKSVFIQKRFLRKYFQTYKGAVAKFPLILGFTLTHDETIKLVF